MFLVYLLYHKEDGIKTAVPEGTKEFALRAVFGDVKRSVYV